MSTIPSISLIPSGYKANKVYSVLPTDGAADLTFARTSSANRVNSDNLIEEMATGVPRLDYSDGTCPSLLLEPQSTNLITYPLSFGNNYWTKSGANIEGDSSTSGVEKVVNGDFSGGITGWSSPNYNSTISVVSGQLKIVNTSLFGRASQAISTVIGKTYFLNATITNIDNSTGIRIKISNNSSLDGSYYDSEDNSTTTAVEIKYYFVASAITTYIGSSSYGSVGDASYLDNVSVKEVQGFSAPSVDNPLEAYKLITDTSTGGHDMYSDTLSFAANTTYTFSSYIKKGELNIISMQYNSAGAFTTNPVTEFNLDTGVVVSSINGLGAITELGNGWYKCSITATTGASTSLERAWFRFGTSTGDGTSGVYMFGAQLEEQSYATSLMLPNTEGSTVTRVAETVSKSGLASYINSTEGVLYFEGSNITNGKDSRISLSDGTLNNRVSFAYSPISNEAYFIVKINGATVVLNLAVSLGINQTQNMKWAIRYKTADTSLFLNGVELINSSVAFSAAPLSVLNLGSATSAIDFYGNCKDLRVYKTALTDAELVTLTTI